MVHVCGIAFHVSHVAQMLWVGICVEASVVSAPAGLAFEFQSLTLELCIQ